MVKILVVDDESIKYRAICNIINDDSVEIDNVPSISEALSKMHDCYYDLVVIDIIIPESRDDIYPNKNGGLKLIDDIKTTLTIKKPNSIICITSDSEIAEKLKKQLFMDMIHILLYDLSNNDWKQQIKNKVEYLKCIDSQNDSVNVDIAIITAVDDEYNALKEAFSITGNIVSPYDPSSYFIGAIDLNGTKQSVLLVKLPEMGMTAASNTTTKIITQFHPKKVFMVGICGGIRNEVELGDLVVASSSWDYGSGKIKPKNDKDKNYYSFEPSPNTIAIDTSIKDKIDNLSQEALNETVALWNDKNQSDTINPKLHISPLPSGSSVISDETLFYEIIKPQNRKCAGIDMETYGVYYAVKNTTKENVSFLSIKAVSDFADKEKNDDYHEKCCFLSVNFLKKCLEKEIL